MHGGQHTKFRLLYKQAWQTKLSKKNIDKYRDEVKTHLQYIKERVDENHSHLEKVNGRLNKAENNITIIKTTGVTLYTVIAAILAWLGINK